MQLLIQSPQTCSSTLGHPWRKTLPSHETLGNIMTTQPKKWIRAEIETLDPHEDYVRIWQLGACYGANEFIQNLIYALTFPNFVVTEWGSEVVWREDGGKVVSRANSRVEQTQAANALWWWYGPHHEKTKKSVEGINRLHAFWAKKYPGAFAYNEDYVYVCAFTAVSMHRLRLRMGLPGLSEKEQIAAHKFWGEMLKLFRAENETPLYGYPEDFAGLIRFCEAMEQEERPKPERGNLITSAIFEQFVSRFFPPEMHWLGHQLIRSLSLPSTLNTMQIDPPLPMAAEVLPKLMGLVFWHAEMYEDDPPLSYVEQRESMGAEQRRGLKEDIEKLDQAFPAHFTALYGGDARFAGCPFHTALRQGTSTPSDDSPIVRDIEEAVVGAIGVANAG
ncbi:hypothetical protein OU995_07910 [Roseateles sp. SL47]|uniref:hypothetical protein n=1 Tax=Roseateles sp. SL47 TaxID=2995138 RepID=UPI00226E5CAA|nr:hypothetical protein [Roseateles sp. SL47]WAC74619.1 hypothetical protein OU995_07910 [Roseateles sp. SL47]